MKPVIDTDQIRVQRKALARLRAWQTRMRCRRLRPVKGRDAAQKETRRGADGL